MKNKQIHFTPVQSNTKNSFILNNKQSSIESLSILYKSSKSSVYSIKRFSKANSDLYEKKLLRKKSNSFLHTNKKEIEIN